MFFCFQAALNVDLIDVKIYPAIVHVFSYSPFQNILFRYILLRQDLKKRFQYISGNITMARIHVILSV